MAGAGAFWWRQSQEVDSDSPVSPTGETVSNFEECQAAGFPVRESYPATCAAGDEVFTQDIGNELDYADEIRIDNPRPQSVISSPLNISGEARGSWYFEATFPVKLVDETGKTLAESYATAQGEWMSEEFVPFTASLNFDPDELAIAMTLILEKANPSGLPENAAELRVPVKI